MDSPDDSSYVSASSGNDPSSDRAEVYGPIGFRRYVKDDGRALIIYTQGRSTDGGSAHEGSARA